MRAFLREYISRSRVYLRTPCTGRKRMPLCANKVHKGGICSLWRYGDIVDVERIDDRPYIDVARYITKEAVEGKPVGAQMWTPSRNLEKPTVESMFIDENETIQPPPGAFVMEKEEKQNEFGNFIYLKYQLPVERKPFHPRPPYRRKRPKTE